MLLKELPQGSTVYALSYSIDSVNAVETKIAAKASDPHYRNQQRGQQSNSPIPMMNQINTEVVVDIYVDINGNTVPFEINEKSTVARGKNPLNGVEYVVSTEKDVIIKELKEVKSKYESFLNLVPKYENNSRKCDEILNSWDPATAEKKRNDQRLASMENRIGGMEDKINKMFEEFQNMNRK